MNDEELNRRLAEVDQNSEDIQQSLRMEFLSRWEDQRFSVSAIFINFSFIWDVVNKEMPGTLGIWTEKFESNDELTDLIGPLAEPFADYVNSTRRYIVLHHLNLYLKLELIELTFDPETLSEIYTISANGYDSLSTESIEVMEALISANTQF